LDIGGRDHDDRGRKPDRRRCRRRQQLARFTIKPRATGYDLGEVTRTWVRWEPTDIFLNVLDGHRCLARDLFLLKIAPLYAYTIRTHARTIMISKLVQQTKNRSNSRVLIRYLREIYLMRRPKSDENNEKN
jgi:hypothetical protein